MSKHSLDKSHLVGDLVVTSLSFPKALRAITTYSMARVSAYFLKNTDANLNSQTENGVETSAIRTRNTLSDLPKQNIGQTNEQKNQSSLGL